MGLHLTALKILVLFVTKIFIVLPFKILSIYFVLELKIGPYKYVLCDKSFKICSFHQNGFKCILEILSELSFYMYKISSIIEENHNRLVEVFVYDCMHHNA